MNVPEPILDHLVYATSDLEATCRDLETRLGVRASAGGQHPGDSRQHPADSAITGPRLVQLRLEHPEPELIRKQLNSLRVEVAIEQRSNPALVAIFEGANDLIELK